MQPDIKPFPAHLSQDVAAVVLALADSQWQVPMAGFTVQVQGEPLHIPYRLFYQQEQILRCADKPGNQGAIALCVGTRHPDGFLREACARRLVALDHPWVVPFVVQLAGEYVLQIVQVIEQALPTLNAQVYGDYLRDNAALHAKFRRRVVSYWNEYHRNQFPKLRDYPGTRVLKALDAFAATAPLAP